MSDGQLGEGHPMVAGLAAGQPVVAAGQPVVAAGQPVVLLTRRFTAELVTELRHAIAAQVTTAGLTGAERDDFVLAAHELVTNAVRHGGGSGRLDLRRQDDVLVCEVTDYGVGTEELAVELPESNVPGGRGLWLAHRLTGALMLTRRPDGVTASVSVCLTPQAVPAGANPVTVAAEGDVLTESTAQDDQP